jgi:hypothetical protein
MKVINYKYKMSQIGSRASQRSKVGKNSYVDEALFGGSKKPATSGGDRKVACSTGVITLDELRTIRGKTEKNS